MKKSVHYLILILGVLLIVNLFVIPLIEPSRIYYPAKKIRNMPSSVGLEYEDVYIKTGDGSNINGWFVKNDASKKVILYFHGNSGNIGDRVDDVKLLFVLPANIFIIDYHGYGKSEGKPSEQNLYLDAQAAYDFLLERKGYRPEQIVVMGSSLGGAVAAYLAANRKVGGLILKSTFTSAPDMAPRMNPLYRRPVVWIRSSFDSLSRMSKINAPKLIVHSKEDKAIPYAMSVKLYEKASEPKKLLLLEKGEHNDLITAPEYINSLKKILTN